MGNHRGETAKSLLTCKAVPDRIFNQRNNVSIVKNAIWRAARGVWQHTSQVYDHPRQNPAYRARETPLWGFSFAGFP